jgi:hypothetical protein
MKIEAQHSYLHVNKATHLKKEKPVSQRKGYENEHKPLHQEERVRHFYSPSLRLVQIEV